MVAMGTEGGGSFDEFIETCSKAYEKTKRELEEIELLIKQTTEDVERMARRNSQATNQLRQAESSIDTVPRGDLQEAYSTVLDTQRRLFTMRGQLEKLESNQRNTARYLDVLQGILEFSEDSDLREAGEEAEEGGAAQASVVRIIEAQERERRRLSKQMHDGPAQSLTNLILQAEICERLMDSDPKRAREELKHLKNSAAGTFQKVKGFILNLRPMMLDDLGLIPTLRRYLDSLSEASDMTVDLTVVGKERRLASHNEVTTFRIIQELLSNAEEVSRASSARITLDLEGRRLEVIVEDDGEGLEINDALESDDADELGLTTMRERVRMLGGEIHFDSELGRGTTVTFDLPIS